MWPFLSSVSFSPSPSSSSSWAPGICQPRSLFANPRSLEDGGRREIYICWHTHIVTLYPVRGNFACDTSEGAQLGNACGNPSKTKLPFCPLNTLPGSSVGFVWQNLHPFSTTPFCTLGQRSPSAGSPPEPRGVGNGCREIKPNWGWPPAPLL